MYLCGNVYNAQADVEHVKIGYSVTSNRSFIHKSFPDLTVIDRLLWSISISCETWLMLIRADFGRILTRWLLWPKSVPSFDLLVITYWDNKSRIPEQRTIYPLRRCLVPESPIRNMQSRMQLLRVIPCPFFAYPRFSQNPPISYQTPWSLVLLDED